jgi:cation diffusion facilitator family transporter
MSQRSSETTDRRIVRLHGLNAVINLALAGVKVSIGLLAGSGALVADGLNSTSDLLSNLVAWGGYRLSLRPPDEDHHYGHGNAEAIAAALIGMIILAAGGTVIWRLFSAENLTAGGELGIAALLAAALSVGANHWLSRVNLAEARRTHSQVLTALGRDKRSDALFSLLVVVGIGSSLLRIPWIEPTVTFLVGAWVCVLGLRSISEAIDVLMDRVTDPTLRAELAEVAGTVDGVERADEIRIHPLGSTYRADLTIHVNGTLTVERGHEIAQEVEAAVTRRHDRIVQVHVHVEPL